MELLTKLEKIVLKWLKDVPHLPIGARRWIGVNVWWIALIGAILAGLAALIGMFTTLGMLSLLSSAQVSYFASSTFLAWAVVTGTVSLVFVVLEAVLLGMSVTPLKARQKKGWVLLFVTWLLSIVALVVNAILTLNPLSIITSLIFGTLFAAVWGYFLFEIHGQFAHVEKSKGVKAAK